MAYFGFTNKLVKGEKIQIFNYGDMKRDFTYRRHSNRGECDGQSSVYRRGWCAVQDI